MSEENPEVEALGNLFGAVSFTDKTPQTPVRVSSNEEPPTVHKIKIRIKKNKNLYLLDNGSPEKKSESTVVLSEAPEPDFSCVDADEASKLSTEKKLDNSSPARENENENENESTVVLSEAPVPDFSCVDADEASKLSTEKKLDNSSPVRENENENENESVGVSYEEPVPILSNVEEGKAITASISVISIEKNPPWFPHVRHFDLDTTPNLSEFCLREHFVKVAAIVPDTELRKKDANGGKGKKKKGEKARQTLIKFVPTISEKDWKKRGEYIYLLIVDGKIVKLGCSRTSKEERTGGYLSGHGIPEITGGTAGSTNAFIYWTFVWLLSQGKKIEMFSAEIPKAIVVQTFFGFTDEIETQVCHRWERHAMIKYQKQFGKLPPLSSNYDPSD